MTTSSALWMTDFALLSVVSFPGEQLVLFLMWQVIEQVRTTSVWQMGAWAPSRAQVPLPFCGKYSKGHQ